MFSYVFNEGKWIETEKIYPHDIVLLLEPKDKKIYLWTGSRAPNSLVEEALLKAKELKEKYTKFELVEVGDVLPMKVEAEIEERIDRTFEETQKVDRDPQYVLFIIFNVIGLISAVISYTFLLNPIAWDRSPFNSTIYVVTELYYNAWYSMTTVVILVTAIIFAALTTISLFTRKGFLIITSGLATAVQVGTYQYIRLGIYLFDFQDGANPGYYNILIADVALFAFLNILAFITIIIPSVISIKAILSDTRPISLQDWLEKQRKTSVTLTKYSIIADRPSITSTMVDKPYQLNEVELPPKPSTDEDIELKLIG